MVGPSRGERGFLLLIEGSCSWVGKGDVEDMRAGGGVEWELGEDTGNIEERKAEVCCPVEVGGRN